MADFDDLTKTLSALTNNFTAQSLSKMNKAGARVLRKSNATRIRANITPENGAMVPRATPKLFNPPQQARFLYPSGGSGAPRLVQLSAWTVKGKLIIGFDEKKGAERHFLRSKIIKWLSNERPKLANNSAAPLKSKPKKPGKMFQKLPKPAFFKAKADSSGFKIGFFGGSTGDIAFFQHHGAPSRHLPERPLLGINENDADLILEEYIKQIDF